MLSDPAKSCFNAEVSVLPFPEAFLEDELPDEIELCGVKLKVLATPGHSAGSAWPEREFSLMPVSSCWRKSPSPQRCTNSSAAARALISGFLS